MYSQAETGSHDCMLLTPFNVFFQRPGALATVGALSYGLFSFVRGDARMQQYMMRTRVAAQGGTLIAVAAGVTYMLYRDHNNSGKT